MQSWGGNPDCFAWAWTGLALHVSTETVQGASMRTLYAMMRSGDMFAAVGGIDHVGVVTGAMEMALSGLNRRCRPSSLRIAEVGEATVSL